MMMRFFAVAFATTTTMLLSVEAAPGVNELEQVFLAQQRQDSTIFAASVHSQVSNSQSPAVGGAFGQRDPNGGRLMYTDSTQRINNMAEMLLVAAALTLDASGQLTIDSNIPNTQRMVREIGQWSPLLAKRR